MGRAGLIGLGGIAVVGAAVVGLQAVLADSPSCAATLPAAARTAGKATFYDLTSGAGNCSLTAPRDGLFVALPAGEYAGGSRCGGYLQVRGPRGSVRVEVIDKCPECGAGHIDLSRTAFSRIADPRQGEVAVSYQALTNPPLPGPLSFRVKEGSSAFFLDLLPINTGNPLASVTVSGPGRSAVALRRKDFGYWEAASGLGAGPFTVRLKDVAGHVVTVRGIRLKPGTVQNTQVRMYGAGSRTVARPPAAAAPKKKAVKAKRSPSPAPVERTPATGAPVVPGSEGAGASATGSVLAATAPPPAPRTC